MRGQEWHLRSLHRGFLIPMRGNEYYVILTQSLAWMIPNPHEG